MREDGSDYSIHQFIAKDEARDPEGSDDTEVDAVSILFVLRVWLATFFVHLRLLCLVTDHL